MNLRQIGKKGTIINQKSKDDNLNSIAEAKKN